MDRGQAQLAVAAVREAVGLAGRADDDVSAFDDNRLITDPERCPTGLDDEDLGVRVTMELGAGAGCEWTRMIENGTSPCSAPANSWAWRLCSRSSKGTIDPRGWSDMVAAGLQCRSFEYRRRNSRPRRQGRTRTRDGYACRVLKIGLNLPYTEGQLGGATPRWTDILAMARAAEAMGFDGLWISDHVGFGEPDGEWQGAWESWTLLSALAAATERVTLGTYVACAPFRNPALLAKMAETLDEVSGGRAILGLGAGWNEPEFRAYGVPFDDRFDRFEDSLRIVAAMLRTGTAHHDGVAAQANGARLAPRGPRPAGLPIMVGASGPRLLRLTAELADRWNGGLRRLDEVPRLLRAVDAACAALDRDLATLERSVEVLVRTVPRGDGDVAEDREIQGSPEAIAEVLLAFADLGVAELQVQLRPNTPRGVDAFAGILDALRR